MKLHVYKDKTELSEAMASWICDLVTDTLKNQEIFTLVLSGGSTPNLLYKKLASPEMKEKIAWKKVHIFWGDERVVPFSDERNNAKVAFDILIDQLDIPSDNVHIMRTDIEPYFAVDAYGKILHQYFDNSAKSFDLVLLGMGDDGHTLSLFPESPIIEDEKSWVNSVMHPTQKMYRITLMPAIINQASHIAFMAEGSGKSKIFHRVLEGEYNPKELPAQIIKPQNGTLHWFVDKSIITDLKNL